MSDSNIFYYDQNALEFFQSTVDLDMSPLVNRFTKHLPKYAHILDVGSGSGRDSKTFLDREFQVTSIDPSKKLAKLASHHIGQTVYTIDASFVVEVSKYDGIWASGSLVHLEQSDLQYSLNRLSTSLKPNGILFMSFRYGDHKTREGGRTFVHLNEDRLKKILADISELTLVEYWVDDDVRSDKPHPWFNTLLRKS